LTSIGFQDIIDNVADMDEFRVSFFRFHSVA
jgi:hypothetical protein